MKLFLLNILLICTLNCFAQNCSVNAGVSIQYCPGQQMILYGNVNGIYIASSIVWSQTSGPAVLISNVNSLVTNCGIAQSGATYTFKITAQCQDNSLITNSVTYTVSSNTLQPPNAEAGPASISLGCSPYGQSIQLNATAAPVGFIGKWTVDTGGSGNFNNDNLPNATFTPAQFNAGNPSWQCAATNNSYLLKWTLVSIIPPPANCPSAQLSTYDSIVLNGNFYNPIDANFETPNCNSFDNNLKLYGSCTGNGTVLWTQIAGPVLSQPELPFNMATQNIIITNPPIGNYTFRYTVSGTCVSGFKDVVINFVPASNFSVTSANANPGNIKTGYCTGESIPTSFQLLANLPNAGETGTWSQVSGGTVVVFSNLNSNTSLVTGLTNAGAPYVFKWRINNGLSCNSENNIKIFKINDLVPNAVNYISSCNASINSTGVTNFCSNAANFILVPASGALTNIPNNGSWFLDGYYLNAIPLGSTIALGFKPQVAIIYDRLGIIGNHYSEAADNNCPNNGLTIALFSNNTMEGVGYNFKAFLNTANAQFTGTYEGYFILKNQFCSAQYNVPFTLSISRDVSNANAGTDQFLSCGATQTLLAANNPVATPPFYGVGNWLQISGPNTATIANIYDRNTPVSNLLPGTYSFSWIVNAGTECASKADTVLVNVSNIVPSIVFAGSNKTICSSASTSVVASLAAGGSLSNMLTNTGSVGTWSLVSQIPNGAIPSIVNPNNISTNIVGLIANTVYVFRYTVSNLCGNNFSNITISVTGTDGPTQANAGIDQCLATTSTVTLNANVPSAGIGTWTKLNVGDIGTITNTNNNNTTVTGLNIGAVYGYVWSIVGDASCAISRDTVFISNMGALSNAIARPDLDTCANGAGNTFQLYASPPVVGIGQWVQTSGPSVASFNPNNASTLVTVNANGTYRFNWIVANGICVSNVDEVKVNFYNAASVANISTANTNLCNAATNSISLNADVPVNGIGTWTVISGGGSVVNINSPVTVANLSQGMNIFRWSVSSLNAAICPSTFDDVIVTKFTAANARDTALCRATYAIVKASQSGNGAGVWSLISQPTGSPAVTIIPQGLQDSVASVGPLVVGQYVLRWSVSNSFCGNSFDDMTLTINDIPDPFAGNDACGISGNALQLNGSAITTGTTTNWNIVSAPIGVGTGVFSAPNNVSTNYSITPSSAFLPGNYLFKYQHSNGSCVLSDLVNIKVITKASAGVDQKLCVVSNAVFTMNANAAVSSNTETGVWTFLNTGSATIANSASNTTTVNNINPGDSLNLIWTISGGAPLNCMSKDTVALVNKNNAADITLPAFVFYCDNAAGLNLNGTNPLPGIGSWSLITAPTAAPSLNWVNQFSQNATVNNLTNGTYIFRYSVTNNPCPVKLAEVRIRSTCTALPVKLKSFTSFTYNCTAYVDWITSNEINTNHFELEESIDNGNTWSNIKSINAVGFSSADLSYKTDFILSDNNVHLLRLKIVDNDGTFSYSTLLKMQCKKDSKMYISPNPVFGKFVINGVLKGDEIVLFSATSQKIFQQTCVTNNEQFDISKFSAGIYFIQLRSNKTNEIKTLKIVKQ